VGLQVKIGTRLQEAKEASQRHSGEVDSLDVIKSVTVWEFNFWEACEFSMAHLDTLDPEYIHDYLEEHRTLDPVEHPEHWQLENTPIQCLLQGIPFMPPRVKAHRARSLDSESESFAPSRQSHGVITLREPTSDKSEFVNPLLTSNFLQDGHEKIEGGILLGDGKLHLEMTPVERIKLILDNKSMSRADKTAFANYIAGAHQDWIDVKEHLRKDDPVVVTNFNGKTIRRSNMKNLDVPTIEAVMRWRQGELRKRRMMRYWCVGKPLPDAFQRCIQRLRHEDQDTIRTKLSQVRKSGSTTLDLKAASRVIVENGGGYSAALELNYEIDDPDDLHGGPTPSQQVEIQRTNMMKHFREGKVEAEDVLFNYNTTMNTGSSRGRSVGGRTPHDAIAKPISQVDLYKARYFGDDDSEFSQARSISASDVYSSKPDDSRSVVSKVESRMLEVFGDSMKNAIPSTSASRHPVGSFEQKRSLVLGALVNKKFDRRSEIEKKEQALALTARLAAIGFSHDQKESKLGPDRDEVTFAQAIPAQRNDPYAYGGVDGKTQEPMIAWDGGLPYINLFNNEATVTTVSMKRYNNRK